MKEKDYSKIVQRDENRFIRSSGDLLCSMCGCRGYIATTNTFPFSVFFRTTIAVGACTVGEAITRLLLVCCSKHLGHTHRVVVVDTNHIFSVGKGQQCTSCEDEKDVQIVAHQ